jgi:hypothetical protein
MAIDGHPERVPYPWHCSGTRIDGGPATRAGQLSLAGLRTFPLITLWGAICAMLDVGFGGWVLTGRLVSLAAMIGHGEYHPAEG